MIVVAAPTPAVRIVKISRGPNPATAVQTVVTSIPKLFQNDKRQRTDLDRKKIIAPLPVLPSSRSKQARE
jgi:hypothetical protein